MYFFISVVIPAYNSASYIEKAINSALAQKEVREVIVINDGSTDGTLEIIQKCQNQDHRIKIFHHSNRENKGRSASRNLGIKNATQNFIAFLDADDYYLPNRFVNDKEVFQKNKEADGVYNAMGVEFYREYSNDELDKLKLVTVNRSFMPNELFLALLEGKFGHFSLNGLTLKRHRIPRLLIFNQFLEVHEDTNYILKLSLGVNLVSGIINEPLVIRGVHDKNSFNDKELYKKNISTSIEDVLRFLCLIKYRSNYDYRIFEILLSKIHFGNNWGEKLIKAFGLIKFSRFNRVLIGVILSKLFRFNKARVWY